MKKINKLIVLLFIIVNFTNYSLEKVIFLKKPKLNMMKKNMKNQNFYFREV